MQGRTKTGENRGFVFVFMSDMELNEVWQLHPWRGQTYPAPCFARKLSVAMEIIISVKAYM
jgi:hypothetical protein